MTIQKNREVYDFLEKEYPDAKCALDFATPFQCVVAVALSAQTTDKSVNIVTPDLFRRFPDAKSLASASIEDIEGCIKSLGLYHNKARNLKNMAEVLVKDFNGELPLEFDVLTTLPGVGIKTANVVLAECASRPAIAVDTHVSRVSKRLGYAKGNDEPRKIEKILEKQFPKEVWIKLHHRMIFFGRYMCHAQSPECDRCGLGRYCTYKKNSSKTSR